MSIKGKILKILSKIVSLDILEKKLKGDLLDNYVREKNQLKDIFKSREWWHTRDSLKYAALGIMLLYPIPSILFYLFCLLIGVANNCDFGYRLTEAGEYTYGGFRYSGYIAGGIVIFSALIEIFTDETQTEFVKKYIKYIKNRHNLSKKYKRKVLEVNEENKETLKIELGKKVKSEISQEVEYDELPDYYK